MNVSSARLQPSLTRAQCEEALALVLRSQTFGRAEKLQRFLKYVCETTLRGDAALLHEHLVAVDVFGRGEGFSRGEDSVVRRQAHALRRKLKDYYESEGEHDPVYIDLPVGSYVPAFRLRPEPVASPAPDLAEQVNPLIEAKQAEISVAAAPKRGLLLAVGQWQWPLGAAATLLMIGAAFGFGWAVRARASAPTVTSAATLDPVVRELWGPWLSHSDGVVLAFSNPPGASIRMFGGPIQPNPEHQGMPVTADQNTRIREFFQFRPGGYVYMYPIASQAKMGEALAAVSLTSMFTRVGQPVRAMQSRFITWETMRQENIILLGHADSNQWIAPVLKDAPFILASTDELHRARIVNNRPRDGELPLYLPTVPGANRSYALVSMLRGMDSHHQVLVIGGLDTSSTTAAADYMVNPRTAAELLRRLKAGSPDHRGPWSFQMVLETDVRDTVPVNAFPVALRIL